MPDGVSGTLTTRNQETQVTFGAGAALVGGTVEIVLSGVGEAHSVPAGVGTTTDVDFTDSRGAIATATMQTVGETLTCLWNNTDSKWDILSYGNGATGNNIAGAPQGTMDIS